MKISTFIIIKLVVVLVYFGWTSNDFTLFYAKNNWK